MVKSEMVRARMKPALKERVEGVFSSLGLTPSQAIVLFYKQVELHNGLPFDLRVPKSHLVDMNGLTREEFDVELERGYASAMSGRVRPASEARTKYRQDARV